jgi:hypothetical protein
MNIFRKSSLIILAALLAISLSGCEAMPTLEEFEWQFGDYADDFILSEDPVTSNYLKKGELSGIAADNFAITGPYQSLRENYIRVGDRSLPLYLSLSASFYEAMEGAGYIVSEEYWDVATELFNENEYAQMEILPEIADIDADHVVFHSRDSAGLVIRIENYVIRLQTQRIDGGVHPFLIELANSQIAWFDENR